VEKHARDFGIPKALGFSLSGALIALLLSLVLSDALSIPSVKDWLLSAPDNLVTLIGSALVLCGLLATAQQWRLDNESKREEARSRRHAEYAERVAAFKTWQTKSAIMMILNYERDVQLAEGQPLQKVNWGYCELALIPAPYRRYLYEPTLISIRDCFNDFIENVSRLVFLQRQGLVKQEDVDHLCRTLMVRIASETQFAATAFARNLRLYIHWRSDQRVLDLFRHYECDIESLKERDKAALEDDIIAGRYGLCERSSWGQI
jgi:hypothetical protein